MAVEEAGKSVKDLERELNATKELLAEARIKYRNVTQNQMDLKLRYDELCLRLEEVAEAEDNIADKDKQNKQLAAEIVSKDSAITVKHAVNKDAENQLKKLKRDNLRIRIEYFEKEREINQLKHEINEQIRKNARVKETLSFKLGNSLIFGFKSLNGFSLLPKKLLEIKKEAKNRKKFSKKKEAFRLGVGDSSKAKATVVDNYSYIDHELTIDSDLVFPEALRRLKIACIMDEFTYGSYRHECNLLPLTPEYWSREIEGFKPDLLFIESAWQGKQNLWGGKVGHMSQEVVEIVQWCRENKVPTIFWNKEDPIHFETFLNTAKLFEYIFTTDIDCVQRYKTALSHDRVYFLPFAAQPLVNNPIEKYQRKDALCFAGAYYVKYPDRTRDLGNFVVNLPEYKDINIYDRNYGKDDPNYQFPKEYKPFVVGTLPYSEIDKAYKGYNYSINLNSIKQSQSMFARRVYELLASNTITVSNFSRGLRLLFGDLVLTSDSGEQIVQRMKAVSGNESEQRKFRLKALRKVMREHTYQDRIAYIYSKVSGDPIGQMLPTIAVLAYAITKDEAEKLISVYESQSYEFKRLILCISRGVDLKHEATDNITFIELNPENLAKNLPELLEHTEWLSVMVAEDYYGKYFLEDLALATRYTNTSKVIGKAGCYKHHNNKLLLTYDNLQYCSYNSFAARSSICRFSEIGKVALKDIIPKLYTFKHETNNGFSTDEFSYCINGADKGDQFEELTDPILNEGMSLTCLQRTAEKLPAHKEGLHKLPVITPEKMQKLLPVPQATAVAMTLEHGNLLVNSQLPDGKHEYWYANQNMKTEEFGAIDNKLNLYLETTPGLNLQYVLLFLDKNGQRISHVVNTANRNNEVQLPEGTVWIKFGLRIYAYGAAQINNFYLAHKPMQPPEALSKNKYMVLTNNYPSYDDLYKNAFVHSRVKAYKQHGLTADVFRFKTEQAVSYHEFEGIDVTTGGEDVLAKQLDCVNYKHIAVHFLDQRMWSALKEKLDSTKVTVWVHGADIQAYHRRAFLYEADQQIEAAKKLSEEKLSFWRSILQEMHPNLHLVFVSQYLADSVMEDLGFKLDDKSYSIIHNPIDTDKFSYQKKPSEQRKKILSIRPYASKVYANDLAVKAILELSKEPFFNELEFRMIGDGLLFDEILEPIRGFDNVIIERRFLTQSEIAELHKEYGIFLCPSRMDTQGVSRDEAMSSGLVAVTNAVAAIPEFVDENSGLLSKEEDYLGIAENIKKVFNSPFLFDRISFNANRRVHRKTARLNIIASELSILKNDSTAS